MLVTFPIKFPTAVYAITMSNAGTNNTAYASAYSELTTSSVYLADNSDTVHYMVVGQ